MSTAEKVSSESSTNDKLKRDTSSTGTKMAPAERLRPIGASAEEEVCESGGKRSSEDEQKEVGGGGERAVHIIIKPQEDSGSDREHSQEPAQCLPPVM